MKKILRVMVGVVFLSVAAMGQTQPFDNFKKAVENEPGGFSGNKEKLSGVFVEERKDLGDRFETELWGYLGTDPDKHYWISFFVASKSYLHGSDPLPELAFKVRSRAVELLKDKNDDRSLGRKVTMYRMLAVSAKLMGKEDDAVRFHDAAESILRKDKDIGAFLGARSQYDICVYENVAGSIGNCKEDDPAKEKIVSAGILNGKAIKLPQVREYPKAAKKAKAEGFVKIKVLIDFDGNVIEATPVEGRPELFEVTVEAAYKAKFKPTTLAGKPVKVSGVLVYNFVL